MKQEIEPSDTDEYEPYPGCAGTLPHSRLAYRWLLWCRPLSAPVAGHSLDGHDGQQRGACEADQTARGVGRHEVGHRERVLRGGVVVIMDNMGGEGINAGRGMEDVFMPLLFCRVEKAPYVGESCDWSVSVASGNVRKKVEPTPSVDWNHNAPPC